MSSKLQAIDAKQIHALKEVAGMIRGSYSIADEITIRQDWHTDPGSGKACGNIVPGISVLYSSLLGQNWEVLITPGRIEIHKKEAAIVVEEKERCGEQIKIISIYEELYGMSSSIPAAPKEAQRKVGCFRCLNYTGMQL